MRRDCDGAGLFSMTMFEYVNFKKVVKVNLGKTADGERAK